MSNMRNSGVEWIGDIPVEWDVKKGKYDFDFINGFAFDSQDMNVEGNFPVIRIGDIQEGIVSFDNCLYVQDNKGLERYKINKGDLLLAMSGATVGKVGIMNTDILAYINQRVGIIRSDVIKYIYYVLSTKSFLEYIDLESVGSAQPNISADGIKKFLIPNPKAREQKIIADFLDEKVGKIDIIIEWLNKQIEIINNYKNSLITEVIINGLDQNTEMIDSKIDWIGKISKNAKLIKLKYFSYMKGRIGWQGLNSEDFIDEGPYCVTGTDFVNGKINWETCYHVSDERYNMDSNIQLKIGDLLVTKDGTIGKLAVVDELPNKACLNSHLLIIRPLMNKFINKYLYYVLKSKIFYKYYNLVSSGSTMDSLSQEKTGNFIFPIYEIEKQKQIADYLDKKCEQIDCIVKNKQEQIEKIEQYKKSLIYEYVTGKKRVKGAEELYG